MEAASDIGLTLFYHSKTIIWTTCITCINIIAYDMTLSNNSNNRCQKLEELVMSAP